MSSILTEIREIRVEQDKQMVLLTAIKELSTENKTELRRTREVLMKGIFEATEVSKPTTFIVLNEQLPEPTSEEEKEQLMHEIAEDGSGVMLTGELASVTFTEDGPRVEAMARIFSREHIKDGEDRAAMGDNYGPVGAGAGAPKYKSRGMKNFARLGKKAAFSTGYAFRPTKVGGKDVSSTVANFLKTTQKR